MIALNTSLTCRAGFKGGGSKLGSSQGPPQLRDLHKNSKNYYLRKHKNTYKFIFILRIQIYIFYKLNK